MKLSEALKARLDKIKCRYGELGTLLSDPAVIADQEKFRAFSKEHSELEPVVGCYDAYTAHAAELEECGALALTETDPEMKQLLREEADALRHTLDEDAEAVRIALLPRDPDDDSMSSSRYGRAQAATKPRCSAPSS